jgi:hypothetical protein
MRSSNERQPLVCLCLVPYILPSTSPTILTPMKPGTALSAVRSPFITFSWLRSQSEPARNMPELRSRNRFTPVVPGHAKNEDGPAGAWNGGLRVPGTESRLGCGSRHPESRLVVVECFEFLPLLRLGCAEEAKHDLPEDCPFATETVAVYLLVPANEQAVAEDGFKGRFGVGSHSSASTVMLVEADRQLSLVRKQSQPRSGSLPIFHHQAGNPTKLGRVVRHERAAVGQRDRSDLQIIRSNRLTERFKVTPNRHKVVGCGVVIG